MTKLQNAIGLRLALALGALSAPSIKSHLKRQEGQTFVEYALILALISVALVAALTVLRKRIEDIFSTISHDL
jgi:Flp pilus assembly pilin Flp